jgi:uncharacterized protein
MSQISLLFRLQQIDSQLDKARSSLQRVERELSDTSQLEEARQNLLEVDKKYQTETKNLRNAQNRSYEVRVKIELSESSLYGGKIHNPKELQELQNEVASLKRLVTTLEDHELEAMMAVEQEEDSLNDAKIKYEEAQGKLIERNATLEGEKTKILDGIDRLDSERMATLPPIPPTDLALYEQLRKMRNGVAVIKISSGACGACGATLTAALIQSTQVPGQLIRCPTCGRILYPG